MSIYSSALVWMALAAQVVAWPELHQANTGFMRLPPNERVIVERLLRPQLGPLAQGEGSAQMNQAIQSFRVERLTLAGTPAIAVQASGEDFCGATGNCMFWIVDLHQQRIMLRSDGVQAFTVDHASKSRVPDVITRTHESASEGELIRWQFTGGTYSPSACATEQTADADGNPLPQSKTTPHSCSPEGN